MNLVQHNIDLQPFNTLNLHSIAKDFLYVESEEELRYISKIYHKGREICVLGGGSNTIFSNEETSSFVAKIVNKGICIVSQDKTNVFIECAAGENWKDFVIKMCQNNYCGFENLAGIYGSVGAAPVQNIGAYGAEVKDVVDKVLVYDLEKEDFCYYSAEECKFGYRNSIFKYQKGNLIIWKVTFKLKKHFTFNSSYKAVKEAFANTSIETITPIMVAEKIMKIRDSKLPNPKEMGNVGSFFKNPVISIEQYENLKKFYPNIVSFEDDNGRKISAAWLIEQCGFKGKQVQGVGMHNKQALVLVNYGVEDNSMILSFADAVAESVRNTFGIILEKEPHVVK